MTQQLAYQILLGFSYVLPLFLVIWLWFGSKLGNKSKLVISLLLPLLYYFHWTGLKQSKGWPADTQLPERFELISADVVEPNTLKDVTGNIHLWVRTKNHAAPRAYVLPYSRALHKMLFETKQKINAGRAQMGLVYESGSGGSGANLGSGLKLNFKDTPRSHLPPKK